MPDDDEQTDPVADPVMPSTRSDAQACLITRTHPQPPHLKHIYSTRAGSDSVGALGKTLHWHTLTNTTLVNGHQMKHTTVS